MNNDEFCKTNFKPFMTIYYENGNVKDEFMLVGIDMQERLLYLEIHDGQPYKSFYPDGVFPARIEHCWTSKQKPFKILVSNLNIEKENKPHSDKKLTYIR